MPAGARFCPGCGHELARRADERRVVTVLFADIVGFTSFSETRDPEHVKNLVDRCFALLADDITFFGGQVDKVIGDAILALFGAPITHEDDAERAVRAALRMMDTVESYGDEIGLGIRLRIGINTGEVLVGGLRAGDYYTAMGDVVNTANRLQVAADPGTVLVGADTHSATEDVIRYGPGGHLHARGREQLVAMWRAIEAVGRPGERRSGPSTPIVGREPELALLRRAVGTSVRRSRAHLLAIGGESGLGKSRVASEVVDVARREHSAVVLYGRCLPYGEADVWWPLVEAVKSHFGVDPEATIEEGQAVLEAGVADLFANKNGPTGLYPDGRAERVRDALLHLLDYPSRLADLDPSRAAEETAWGLRGLLFRLSEDRPVVLWLSDLQWGDDVVLQFLEGALDRLARRRLVVISTSLPELIERWLPRPLRFSVLSLALDPLDDAAADLLLQQVMGSDSDAAHRRVLIERAGGNPLFLEEMARMFGSGMGTDALPANIRSLIGARLDGLDVEARSVLEDAAVLGLRGSLGALQQMGLAVSGADDIRPALSRLVTDALLELDGDMWSFRSTLVRDVAYSRLTKSERARRHAGIGAAIESRTDNYPEAVANHYRRAAVLDAELGGVPGLPPDLVDRVVLWTTAAAAALIDSDSPGRARRIVSDTLELLDSDDERRVELLIQRARSDMARQRASRASEDITSARALMAADADVHLELELTLLDSEAAQWSGDLDGALASAEKGLRLVEALGDDGHDHRPLLGAALRRAGMVQLFLGRHEDAEASITAAVGEFTAADDARGLAWARQSLAWITYMQGSMDEAERRLDEALAVFRELGDSAGIAWSYGLLAYVRIFQGRFAESVELAERTLQEASELGDSWGQGMMLNALGTASLWTGHIGEAVRNAEEAKSIFAKNSDHLGVVQAEALLGRALVQGGRVQEGQQLFRDRASRIDDEGMDKVIKTAAMAAAAAVGDLDEADDYRDGLDADDIDLSKLGQADRIIAAAITSLQKGDPDTAARLLEQLPPPGSDKDQPWGWSVGALVEVALGGDVEGLAAAVASSPQATYGDRALALVAKACGAARRGDDAAVRAAIDSACASVPEDGDVLYPAIVALARASCLRHLGTEDADYAEMVSREMVDAVGAPLAGWVDAFETVLSAVPVSS